MKKIIIVITLLLTACSPLQQTLATPAPVQPFGQAGNWSLIFSDEFNGSTLDVSKWRANWLGGSDTAITPPINSSELSCYNPANTTVSGGILLLTAVSNTNSACKTRGGGMADYSSGMVQSNGHFNSAYGYYEARILNPSGVNHASAWPAFWTNGQSWPTNGEIDIMECYGTDPSCSYHYHWSGGVAGGNSTVLGSTNEFHIYAAYWQPDKVQWFYDGVLVGTKTGGIIPSPHYIIANLGVIGTQVIIPSIMQVDYIRVWSSGNVIPTNTAQTVTATNTPAHSTATKTATSTATMLPVTITPPAVIPTATFACISYPTYEICSRPKP